LFHQVSQALAGGQQLISLSPEALILVGQVLDVLLRLNDVLWRGERDIDEANPKTP